MTSDALRYTLMRLMVLAACILVLWLAGLRSSAELPWLLLGGFLASMVVSWLLLRPFRDAVVSDLMERRANRAPAPINADQAAEDAESEYR